MVRQADVHFIFVWLSSEKKQPPHESTNKHNKNSKFSILVEQIGTNISNWNKLEQIAVNWNK